MEIVADGIIILVLLLYIYINKKRYWYQIGIVIFLNIFSSWHYFYYRLKAVVSLSRWDDNNNIWNWKERIRTMVMGLKLHKNDDNGG